MRKSPRISPLCTLLDESKRSYGPSKTFEKHNTNSCIFSFVTNFSFKSCKEIYFKLFSGRKLLQRNGWGFRMVEKKRRDREFVELPVCCVLCVLVKCLLLVSRVLLHIYCVRCELVTCLLFVPCEFVVFRCGGSILITCIFSHILHNVFAGNRVT